MGEQAYEVAEDQVYILTCTVGIENVQEQAKYVGSEWQRRGNR